MQSIKEIAMAAAQQAANAVFNETFAKAETRKERKARQRDAFITRLKANRSHKFFSETPNYRDPETRQQVRRDVRPWLSVRRKFPRMNNAPSTPAMQRQLERRPSFSLGAAMGAKARL